MITEAIFAPGARVVIRDEEWLVRSCSPVSTGGMAVRVVGTSELVRNCERTFLTALDEVLEMRPEETVLVTDESPQHRRSRLFLEALLRRTPPTDNQIYLGDKGAMNFAGYQMVPAYRALGALRPRILIADGVGIGKTLEVGVLLAELIKRGRGERILVVAMKSLLAQLQQELWTRFTIPLVRLDTVGLQRVRSKIPANKNPFYYFNKSIISIDTLKNDGRYRTYLEQCRWDVVVIDECHHVANADAQRNRLATLLAGTCDAMIMTSATPHNGKPESFANLMNMLDPTAIANPSDYSKDEIRGLFVRRFKKDVEDEVGEHFQERKTVPRWVNASEEEIRVLRRLKSLKFHTLDVRNKGGNKDVLFRTTLLKAFLSSPDACLETVQNRKQSIQAKLKQNPANRSHLENDFEVLDMFAEQLERLIAQGFGKLKALDDYLHSIGWSGKANSPRILIFSERKKSLDVLRDHLKEKYQLPDNAVRVFHAGLADTEQMELVEDFGKKDSPIRALIATDVASEGVNLHFECNHLVHFDIPWSLITIEQRNGRIDRYGQEKTPNISYLLLRSDDEELKADLRLLEILIKKEAEAHKNIGDASVFLGLHDSEKEAEYVEEQLSAGKAPEDIFPETPVEEGFLALLMGSEAVPSVEDRRAKTLSLFPSDLAFVQAAFEEIVAKERSDVSQEQVLNPPDYHPSLPALTFTAPDDLKRRCEFLPHEAIPPRWEFSLTTDRDRIQAAMAEARRRAREGENSWPHEQLLWELHPMMQWLLEKVLIRFDRHAAPIVVAPSIGAGRIAYLFEGIFSNRRSQPVVVEWFAVTAEPSGKFTIQTLEEVIKTTGFDKGIANLGKTSSLADRAEDQLEKAVGQATKYMTGLRGERTLKLQEKIRDDGERFRRWHQRSLQQVEDYKNRRRLPTGRLPRDVEESAQRRLNDIEQRRARYEQWLQETMEVVGTPYLKLAAVFASA